MRQSRVGCLGITVRSKSGVTVGISFRVTWTTVSLPYTVWAVSESREMAV